MFLTVHTTTAIILTKGTTNPLLALCIGLASHFLLDAIPHGDEKIFNRWTGKQRTVRLLTAGIIDLTITTLWLYWLYSTGTINITLPLVATVGGALLPDFISGLYLATGRKIFYPIHYLNDRFHRLIFKNPLPLGLGLTIQLLFFVFGAMLLLR